MCLILIETYERRNSYPSSQRSDTARHEYDNRVFRETSPSSCFCFIKNWLLDTQRHAPPVHQKTTTGVWRPIWTKKHKQQSTIQDLASPITSSHWCVCVCNGKLCISCKSSLFCVRLQEQRWSSSLEYTKTNGGWRHILGEYKSHEQQTIHKTKVIVIGMCSCVCVCWVACISQYRARCLFHAIEFLTRRHQTHTWDDTCRQTAAASEVYWSEATWKMPLIVQRSVCVCVCSITGMHDVSFFRFLRPQRRDQQQQRDRGFSLGIWGNPRPFCVIIQQFMLLFFNNGLSLINRGMQHCPNKKRQRTDDVHQETDDTHKEKTTSSSAAVTLHQEAQYLDDTNTPAGVWRTRMT